MYQADVHTQIQVANPRPGPKYLDSPYLVVVVPAVEAAAAMMRE